MRAKSMIRWISVLSCLLAAAVLVNSQTKKGAKPKPTATGTTVAAPAEPPMRGPNTKEGASQAAKSAKVLTEIMGTPESREGGVYCRRPGWTWCRELPVTLGMVCTCLLRVEGWQPWFTSRRSSYRLRPARDEQKRNEEPAFRQVRAWW